MKKKKLAVFMMLILAIAGSFLGFRKYREWKMKDENISLEDAAKVGEMMTHKLMVKIESPKCKPEQMSGCYERGDIVLIKPGDWEFSQAEKDGFLILHMDITDKQSELLVRSLEGKPKEKNPEGEAFREVEKLRKYSVDLSKVEISPDDQKGREITDKIFDWKIVEEK